MKIPSAANGVNSSGITNSIAKKNLLKQFDNLLNFRLGILK